MRILLRGETWRVLAQTGRESRSVLSLESSETGRPLDVLCPLDEYTVLPDGPPRLERRSHAQFRIWHLLHDALRLASPEATGLRAFWLIGCTN